LAQVYLHLVFSTKGRRPFLQDQALRERLHAYLSGACKKMDCPSLIVGGVQDHVHILCRFGRSISLMDFLRELKRDSSKWIKSLSPDNSEFQWQTGYGAFSVSPSHLHLLKSYIENQEAHHRRESFQDEFRRMLKKYRVEYDERYVWD